MNNEKTKTPVAGAVDRASAAAMAESTPSGTGTTHSAGTYSAIDPNGLRAARK